MCVSYIGATDCRSALVARNREAPFRYVAFWGLPDSTEAPHERRGYHKSAVLVAG